MTQRQLKLRVNDSQRRTLERWLWQLTGVWNWALSQLEHSPWRLSKYDLEARTLGHSQRCGIPQELIKSTLVTAHVAWERFQKGVSRRPRRKGIRRRLNSIGVPRGPVIRGRRVSVPGLVLRFHRQDIPAGALKCGRLVRRAAGWYLSVVIDADRPTIPRVATGAVGIDPGFKSLLALSTGETVDHPRELEAAAARLAQAQRGRRARLAARLQERLACRRRDRNHKLSRDLVSRFTEIYFSKDRTAGIAKRFGKSVASSGHSQLRQMLAYKSLAGGARYVEVDSKLSTKTCSACGALSGPSGLAGLSVRRWTCACGATHDRDCNAAVNTLIAGLGRSHERGSPSGSRDVSGASEGEANGLY